MQKICITNNSYLGAQLVCFKFHSNQPSLRLRNQIYCALYTFQKLTSFRGAKCNKCEFPVRYTIILFGVIQVKLNSCTLQQNYVCLKTGSCIVPTVSVSTTEIA